MSSIQLNTSNSYFESFSDDSLKNSLTETSPHRFKLKTSATFPQSSMTQTPPKNVEIDLEETEKFPPKLEIASKIAF
jgi:hypothetical protein